MVYKTEMKKFLTFDISDKRIFLLNFFDDIRFKLDCVFLSSSFKHKKEDLEKINKCHNKLAETVHTYEKKCFNELGFLDGREIIWFKKYHLRERDSIIRRFSTCELYIEAVRDEWRELKLSYGGFSDEYDLKEFYAYAIIRDYYFNLMNENK
jgi:hypothetical protein